MTESLEGLRKFHNWIKLQIILDAQRNTDGISLLDIAVGRGGDIMKWTLAKLKFVTGFDIDTKSIYEKHLFDGAIKRYNNLKHYSNTPKCYFWNISAIDPDALSKINGKDKCKIYDIVSCQFSMHYFVNDIDTTLDIICKKLKTGGHFIGTAADGDEIHRLLKDGNSFENENICIKNMADERMYSFELKNSKTSQETYFEYRGASIEYFLYKDHLIEKCKERGLELLNISSFYHWYNLYHKDLTNNEQVCSFLNFSFVFKKI